MTTDPNQLREVVSQHPRTIAVAAICAFIAGFFGLWNALLEMEVVDLVNAKLPPEKQYPIFWGNFRYFDLRSEYKKLFPSGTLLEKADKVKLMAVFIFIGGLFLQVLVNRLWP
jgi:hypothetical protein